MVAHIPSADTLIDIFAGGCAVTHAALLEGRWGRYVANDVSDAPRLFLDAVNGKYADETRVPTRDEFFAQKDGDPYIRYLFSFGNNGRDYLYGRSVEDVKVEASRMLVAPTLHERYQLYRSFIRLLFSGSYRKRQVVELQGLEGLERLQGLEVTQLDYRDVEIPDGAVVYADPPYAGTDCGEYGGFDHDAFEEWLASCDRLVVVSEYHAPNGCVEVAHRQNQCSAAANGKSQRVTERLFVHESQLERYARAMEESEVETEVDA